MARAQKVVSEAAWVNFLDKAQRLAGWDAMVGRYRLHLISRAFTEAWPDDRIGEATRGIKAVAGFVLWLENQRPEVKQDGRKSRYAGQDHAGIAATAGATLATGAPDPGAGAADPE